jgi:hypothetical protein
MDKQSALYLECLSGMALYWPLFPPIKTTNGQEPSGHNWRLSMAISSWPGFFHKRKQTNKQKKKQRRRRTTMFPHWHGHGKIFLSETHLWAMFFSIDGTNGIGASSQQTNASICHHM